MRSPRLIQAIFYNDPDRYPPIVNSARLLAGAGFNLDLLCRENGERWAVNYPAGVRLHRIDTRGRTAWHEYLGFVRRVLGQAHSSAACFAGHDMHGLLPARLLATRYRRPLVYHCHDYAGGGAVVATKGSRLVRAFEQRFARTADLILVPDAERGDIMAQELRLRRAPFVAANAPLRRPIATGEALRLALADQGMHFDQVVLRQGRIGAGHSIETTLQSIPRWGSRRWGYVLLGSSDAAYLDHLRTLAQSLGVTQQVAVLPPVGYDHVAQFTPGADVGHALYEPLHVNNAYITTASNKIMEYMAAGVPLLVSDRPSLRRLVERYNCGLTADERAPESIAAAVNTLLGDPALARRMGAAGRQAFEQVFCYERQFAPALKALQALCR